MPGSRSNHYAAYVIPSQAEAEAGTSDKKRVWSALRVKQAIAALASSGDVVDDTTPQLGGNLDVNGNSIVSASDGDIAITPNGTGSVIIDGISHPQADGTNTQIQQTDGAGQLSWVDKPAGSGDSLPIVDTTSIVKGSADATKQVRIEADGITTSTTRVITMADADIDLTPGTGSFATEAEGALAASALQSLAGDATPQLGGDLDLNGNNLDFPSTANISDCLDEDAMGSDSATALATQQSIKKYVDDNAGGSLTLGTEVAGSSTSHDFTGIPAGTKRIVVQFVGVSQDGAAQTVIVQLGDAGGIETTGYLGSVSSLNSTDTTSTNTTTGMPAITNFGDAGVAHGTLTLTLEDATNFTWVATGVLGNSNTAANNLSGGSKSLSAELTQLRITTVAGTASFDAGAFNILYE